VVTIAHLILPHILRYLLCYQIDVQLPSFLKISLNSEANDHHSDIFRKVEGVEKSDGQPIDAISSQKVLLQALIVDKLTIALVQIPITGI
jgi:hypothetical protein